MDGRVDGFLRDVFQLREPEGVLQRYERVGRGVVDVPRAQIDDVDDELEHLAPAGRRVLHHQRSKTGNAGGGAMGVGHGRTSGLPPEKWSSLK